MHVWCTILISARVLLFDISPLHYLLYRCERKDDESVYLHYVTERTGLHSLVLGMYDSNNIKTFTEGPSWLWSYCSWIYNYLCTSAYHLKLCDFEPRLLPGLLYTTLWDTVWQRLAADRWFLRVLWFPPPIKLTATI